MLLMLLKNITLQSSSINNRQYMLRVFLFPQAKFSSWLIREKLAPPAVAIPMLSVILWFLWSEGIFRGNGNKGISLDHT